MGAGLSKEQERRAKYNGLQCVLRKLRKAGVECRYADKAVRGEGFTVSYGTTLRASNGECFGNLHVEIDSRDYWLLESNHGLDRIKARFGNEQDRLPVTDLAWLVILVERAIMHRDRDNRANDVFLYNADGTPFPTVHSDERGMVYAYNEMQGDKPMLRIGPSSEYTELLPGMIVRTRDGRIIAERKA